MRQTSSGPLTTILMLVPLVVVPLLAMFGLPSFSSSETAPSPELQINALLGQPSSDGIPEGGLQAQPNAGQYPPPGQATSGLSLSGHSYTNSSSATPNENMAMQSGLNNQPGATNQGFNNQPGNNQPGGNQSMIGLSSGSGRSTPQAFDNSSGNNSGLATNNPSATSSGNTPDIHTLSNNSQNGLGLAIGTSARLNNNNAETASPGNPASTEPQSNPRNPFMGDTSAAGATGAATASNFQNQPAAFDPGEFDPDGALTETQPVPLQDNAVFQNQQNNNPVANAGFGTDGFPQQQSNNIMQLSGQAESQAQQQPAAINNFNNIPTGNVPTGNSAAQPTAMAATESGLTWQSAVQLLNKWGIDNFMLQPGAEAGQFNFSCYYTPSEDSRITFRFEAESSQPLKAVENVLQQIQQWHIQRQQAVQNPQQ
ncbi:hypothetical protein Pla110_12560 [Polystyrenella longa]|uniref:Uncharacterized protein n=1 Tax=Polystyrenella longa TaxID=2528007 RepID=A0A518CJZ1_9PLAN|nr:hypothetical protein [Polystyrenella longa]QDU79545.1 hypothetical protein Pla110_12560 [Polystyrenella longa]